MPKFQKSIDELSGMVEKWVYFFKHAEDTDEEALNKIIGSDLIIKRAYDELNRFYWNEIELNTYEQEEKRELDDNAIRELILMTGRAEGKVETSIKIAKKLIKLGVALEVILDATGLTRKDFEQ